MRRIKKEINWEYSFFSDIGKEYRVIIRIKCVKQDNYHPQGVKYPFVLLEDEKRILGYDNHERQGNHKHTRNKIEKIDLSDVFDILNNFKKEVKEYEQMIKNEK